MKYKYVATSNNSEMHLLLISLLAPELIMNSLSSQC